MIFVLSSQDTEPDLLRAHEDAFRWVCPLLPPSPLSLWISGGGRRGRWNTSSLKQNFNVRWSQTHPIPFNSSSSISGLKFLRNRILFDAVHQRSITAVVYCALKESRKKYYVIWKGWEARRQVRKGEAHTVKTQGDLAETGRHDNRR